MGDGRVIKGGVQQGISAALTTSEQPERRWRGVREEVGSFEDIHVGVQVDAVQPPVDRHAPRVCAARTSIAREDERRGA